MLIYGAGGHAKVVTSILSACGAPVMGVFDDNWRNILAFGQHIPGGYESEFLPGEKLVIAIGDNHDRRRLAEKITHPFGKVVHPTAIVDPSVCIGAGAVIVHGAIIQAGCDIGNHVIINSAAIVDHDCILDDFVHIAPGATLCGGVRVGECTLIGAGSVIAPYVSIGRECVVGVGAVVVSDIPDCAKVVGNPGRIIH